MCERILTLPYQIDPGFWYDANNQQVHQIISMDSSFTSLYWLPDSYTGDYVDEAVNSAKEFAQIAKNKGVEVVWEIGNEDFEKYMPQTYATLCTEFIDGITTIDPNAKFSVCSDSYSWSDWTFVESLVDDLDSNQISINYASRHLYLSGSAIFDTAEHIGAQIFERWDIVKYLYVNHGVNDFQDHGFIECKTAITEFNPFSGNVPAGITGIKSGDELEHSIGRALTESKILGGMYQQSDAVFFHDLVRNDPNSSFFARLDYYPDNPIGQNYAWFPEGITESISSQLGKGHIFAEADLLGVTDANLNSGYFMSRDSNSVYILLINRKGTFWNTTIDITDAVIDTNKNLDIRILRAASLESGCFDYFTEHKNQTQSSSSQVIIEVPPYCVMGIKVSIRPGQASNPSPANAATGISVVPTLSWTAGSNTTSHDVYFGTTLADVNEATHVSAEYKGNQAGTSYAPGTLSADTTYYWRIDEVGAGGTTKGMVWNFRTETPPMFIVAGSIASGTGTITPSLPGSITTGDILLLLTAH